MGNLDLSTQDCNFTIIFHLIYLGLLDTLTVLLESIQPTTIVLKESKRSIFFKKALFYLIRDIV